MRERYLPLPPVPSPCLRIGGTREKKRRWTQDAARCYGGVTRLFPSSFSHPPRRTLGLPLVLPPFRSYFLRVSAANERKSPKNNCHRRVPRPETGVRPSSIDHDPSILLESRMDGKVDREVNGGGFLRTWAWAVSKSDKDEERCLDRHCCVIGIVEFLLFGAWLFQNGFN